MFVVDINLIKAVKLSTLYTAKLRCRQQIHLPYKSENMVSYYVTYNKLFHSYDDFLWYNLQNIISKILFISF